MPASGGSRRSVANHSAMATGKATAIGSIVAIRCLRRSNPAGGCTLSKSACRYFPAVSVGQGMIGTALMLFLGLPSISLSL